MKIKVDVNFRTLCSWTFMLVNELNEKKSWIVSYVVQESFMNCIIKAFKKETRIRIKVEDLPLTKYTAIMPLPFWDSSTYPSLHLYDIM